MTAITPSQSRAARALIRWTIGRLAEQSEVGESTINAFELERRTPIPANLAAIKIALEAAGVEFIPGNGGGPGVRLKNP